MNHSVQIRAATYEYKDLQGKCVKPEQTIVKSCKKEAWNV